MRRDPRPPSPTTVGRRRPVAREVPRVSARRAFRMRAGDLRLAAPATAPARELAKTAAREVPAAPADRRTQHRGARLRKRDGKFSCLQRIEKAQNVEIFSATEDGVGATERER